METIRSLIDLLKSQVVLFQEMRDIVRAEKECVTRWDAQATLELAKKKDTLTYKEKILEEARRTIVRTIAGELGLEEPNVSDIIKAVADTQVKDELVSLRADLTKLARELQAENTSLKLLYKTNIGLVNELFTRAGLRETSVYGSRGGGASRMTGNTFVSRG